ncbi:MAG TPA: hypothetical protein VM577_05350 [Anaerovoracaceae bacterium]|nr:hypothetical protein [Anaerovoracaceae bacterium]
MKEYIQAWHQFLLQGCWTKQRPNKPGTYPVAVVGGELAITVYLNPITNQLETSQPWNGYWWSEPRPAMPEFPLD